MSMKITFAAAVFALAGSTGVSAGSLGVTIVDSVSTESFVGVEDGSRRGYLSLRERGGYNDVKSTSSGWKPSTSAELEGWGNDLRIHTDGARLGYVGHGNGMEAELFARDGGTLGVTQCRSGSHISGSVRGNSTVLINNC